MKNLLISMLLLTSFSATAASWTIETAAGGDAVAYSENQQTKSDLVAYVGYAEEDMFIFYEYESAKKCIEAGGSGELSLVLKVNDQEVRFDGACSGSTYVVFAKTKAGQDFIKQAFWNGEQVSIHGVIFSAKGFRKAATDIDNNTHGIDAAL